jgi:hypothetical protein
LCGGGVGAKERSDISKLSLKLLDRSYFARFDIEDMAVEGVVKGWKERYNANDELKCGRPLSSFYGTLWNEKHTYSPCL